MFQSYLQNHPDEQKLVDCMIDDICDSFKGDTGLNTETKDDLNKLINKDSVFLDKLVGLSDRIALFKKDNTPMQTFMLNYIKQFETVLLFIRTTRDRDINLHMKALESLIKYFFAHDHLNYARLLPLYLATMQNFCEKNSGLWRQFEEGRFCISKKDAALQRFFLASPVESLLVKDFESKFTSARNVRNEHHNPHGSKPSQIQENVQALCTVISEHGDPFCVQDDKLYNILTHALVTEKVEEDILNRDVICHSSQQWNDIHLEPMKKIKIGSFRTNNKEIKVTNEKVR